MVVICHAEPRIQPHNVLRKSLGFSFFGEGTSSLGSSTVVSVSRSCACWSLAPVSDGEEVEAVLSLLVSVELSGGATGLL